MEEKIREIKNKHGTLDPFSLLEKLDIILKRSPLGKCHGYLLSVQGIRIIRLNSDDEEPVQRYTLAHELGHYFLHADANYFALKDTLFSSNWQERQADKVAMYLLITEEDLAENPQYSIDDWSAILGISRDIVELRF